MQNHSQNFNDDDDLRIVRGLRRLIRMVDIHSSRLAKTSGITVPQLLCLHKLNEKVTLSQKELAEGVDLNASTIVGIIDRLEDHGFVSRTRSTSDRRLIHVELTTAGRALLAAAPPPLDRALLNSMRSSDPSRRAKVAESLEYILSVLEPHITPALAPNPPDKTL